MKCSQCEKETLPEEIQLCKKCGKPYCAECAETNSYLCDYCQSETASLH